MPRPILAWNLGIVESDFRGNLVCSLGAFFLLKLRNDDNEKESISSNVHDLFDSISWFCPLGKKITCWKNFSSLLPPTPRRSWKTNMSCETCGGSASMPRMSRKEIGRGSSCTVSLGTSVLVKMCLVGDDVHFLLCGINDFTSVLLVSHKTYFKTKNMLMFLQKQNKQTIQNNLVSDPAGSYFFRSKNSFKRRRSTARRAEGEGSTDRSDLRANVETLEPGRCPVGAWLVVGKKW